MADCIIFNKDGSNFLQNVESYSSHLVLVNSDPKQSESFWISTYEKIGPSVNVVYLIAYKERPEDLEIDKAIEKHEPSPVELKKQQ